MGNGIALSLSHDIAVKNNSAVNNPFDGISATLVNNAIIAIIF